ncbi:MAG TPA: cyanophycinase [Pyrinomonadaceae bacterium]|jgi:cyanophycinase|nr:cyanophycinase [Pyrinomonadaceae bacterium]
MELSEARGKLVAIGGGDVSEGDAPLLKEFVKLARGARARVVVMTVATDDPRAAATEYKNAFNRLGVDDVKAVDVSKRADALNPDSLEAIEHATGLFFTGGDQLHITSMIGGTEMQALMHRRYERGLVIGGTSAGAAMMSNSMIVGGGGDDNPKVGAVEIGPGMDLIIGAIIDTHFSQRGRFGRLLTAVAHYPQDMGIGIDEETAMIVNKNEFEVAGKGAVTVIDGGAMTYTSLPYAEQGDGLSLYGVSVHVLAAGSKFDLSNRRPIEAEDKAKSAKASEDGKKPDAKKPRSRRAGR